MCLNYIVLRSSRVSLSSARGSIACRGKRNPMDETVQGSGAGRYSEALIDTGEQNELDLQQFLENVRKYTDPKELTSELLNDLVDKIVIHAPDKSSGKRKQKIEIYYKSAGIINICDNDCVADDGRKERWQKTPA